MFFMQTAIDDFRHIVSRFYALFVDFRDAFGSADQKYLTHASLESGVEKWYSERIAEIYEDSHFELLYVVKNFQSSWRYQLELKQETHLVRCYL